TDPGELAAMGARARELVRNRLGKAALCGRFCDIMERGITPPASGV
ncbi:MAG: hypothetical protein H0T44_06780, partial [Gemmatimonadales bacterium]|nr:hypothetical protein [Gemmatimonadales bacterium]